jgi:chromosome segregation ATPase
MAYKYKSLLEQRVNELQDQVNELQSCLEIATSEELYQRSRAETAEALLYGFTPGGSEYVNDPHRCALHIKERLSGVVEQVKRRKAAEEENKELRQINDVLAAKLDSSIIVNCQALACSAPVAAEVEKLRAQLTTMNATNAQMASDLDAAERKCDEMYLARGKLQGQLNEAHHLLSRAMPRPGVRPGWQDEIDKWLTANSDEGATKPHNFLEEIRKRAAHKYPRFGISVEG